MRALLSGALNHTKMERREEKCGQKVIFFQKLKIKLDYLTRILYNPVFDSWIKERNAEVIGITSFQRFAS